MRALGFAGALLLLGGGVALIVLGWRDASRSGVDRLRAVLGDSTDSTGPDDDEVGPLAVAWSSLVRGAERAGRDTDAFGRLAAALERAGWPLRVGEYAVVIAGAALAGALLGAGLLSGLLGAVLGAGVGAAVPLLLLVRQARRVAEKADAQLPDVLGQLASSLRSGHSLSQGMEAVAEQAPAPLGPQFNRVLAETRVGRTLEEALEAMAERLGSTDVRWTVRAMIIQARTGGKLSDVLEVLAEFMRDREEVRREVRALTADGRISALVLGLLPFFIGGALLVINPEYLTPLVQESLGLVMLAGAGVLMCFAFVWIRKIVRVEV